MSNESRTQRMVPESFDDWEPLGLKESIQSKTSKMQASMVLDYSMPLLEVSATGCSN